MNLPFEEIKYIHRLVGVFIYRPRFSMDHRDIDELEFFKDYYTSQNQVPNSVRVYIAKMIDDDLIKFKIDIEDFTDLGEYVLTLRGLWFFHSISTSVDYILLQEAQRLLE
jgi:hypothetical protein